MCGTCSSPRHHSTWPAPRSSSCRRSAASSVCKRAIDAVLDDYDYVLIDCPPSLGLLTVNGLAAATEVLVPIQCEYYALEGLGQLLRNVDLVKRNLNPTLEISARSCCVMYDARTKLADQVVHEVREHFGDKVLQAVIPRTSGCPRRRRSASRSRRSIRAPEAPWRTGSWQRRCTGGTS